MTLASLDADDPAQIKSMALRRLAEIKFSELSSSAPRSLHQDIEVGEILIALKYRCLETFRMRLVDLRGLEISNQAAAMIFLEVQYWRRNETDVVRDLEDTIIVRDDGAIMLSKATCVEVF